MPAAGDESRTHEVQEVDPVEWRSRLREEDEDEGNWRRAGP